MSNKLTHTFHLVDESPWPIISAMGAFFLTTGLVSFFHTSSQTLMFTGLGLILMVMVQWWRDVSGEGTNQGIHSNVVELGLRWGMILFIVSEVFFFLSFFWSFFHCSLSPDYEIGASWPPCGIHPLNPFEVPLLNTLVLLSSGVSVTWSHHALMEGNLSSSISSLIITVVLGIYFTILQAMEYMESSFSIADSIYGSTFFIATGFHGLHVLIGTLFLMVCLYRMNKLQFSADHHFGFEAAAWYWHFVDVVWLFLFIWIYWWGSK